MRVYESKCTHMEPGLGKPEIQTRISLPIFVLADVVKAKSDLCGLQFLNYN